MTDEQFKEQWRLYGKLRLSEDEEYKALKNKSFVFRWYDYVALVVSWGIGNFVVTSLISVKEMVSFIIQVLIFLVICTLYFGVRMYMHTPPTLQEIEERVKKEYREELERKG